VQDIKKQIIVGITGGIGSGKTTISKHFKALGIPVYHADFEAKALMNRSKVIRRKLIALFGDNAYKNGALNRDYLRSKIFNNKDLLTEMNAIVHPKVGAHFKRWIKKQDAPYVLKEVAIIFENNLQSQYDYVITVVADKEERIKRVMQSDNTSRDSVESIIMNQLPDQEKINKSDFIIENDDLEIAKRQVQKTHKSLINKI
jgi:dephospho-CoA kinase